MLVSNTEKEYPDTLDIGSVRYIREDLKTPRDEATIPGRDEILSVLVKEHEFSNVLDVGCGNGVSFPLLASRGAQVTGIDILPPHRVNTRLGDGLAEYIEADFMEHTSDQKFDAVVASHIIEHIPDTERFLRQFLSFVSPGGTYCIVWPQPKTAIVGGHVHLFIVGLMLYNLVRIGVDCRDVQILRCNYSLGIIGKHNTFEVPPLTHGAGDIEKLSWWFPFPAAHGFDGQAIPGIRDIPLEREGNSE